MPTDPNSTRPGREPVIEVLGAPDETADDSAGCGCGGCGCGAAESGEQIQASTPPAT